LEKQINFNFAKRIAAQFAKALVTERLSVAEQEKARGKR